MSKKDKLPPVKRLCYFGQSRDYSKIVAAELEFFRGLNDAKNQIASIPSNISIQAALRTISPFLQDQGRPLSILVKFEVTDPRSGAEHILFLGTNLQPPKPRSHAQATHFLCLADAETFLVKMHSDFDFYPEAQEKKPSPHVQMGGRVFEALLKQHPHGRPTVCWNEGVDKPRIPTLPLCTALLWHWAFLEYSGSEEVSGFLTAWHWKNLVKRAEEAVLRPYFEDGLAMIDTFPDKGLLNALYIPVDR